VNGNPHETLDERRAARRRAREMKKVELVQKLAAMPADELAALAGVELSRGRPSKALREELVAKVLQGLATKKLTVKKDGSISRRSR
jgi:hypothetical protein